MVTMFRNRGKLMPVVQRVGITWSEDGAKEIAASRYLEMIREVEGEFYPERDDSEQLQEYRLLKRYQTRAQERGINGIPLGEKLVTASLRCRGLFTLRSCFSGTADGCSSLKTAQCLRRDPRFEFRVGANLLSRNGYTNSIPDIQWKTYRAPLTGGISSKMRTAMHSALTHRFRHVECVVARQAATLAYSDLTCPTTFSRASFQVSLFDGNSTQCYVAGNDDFIIVAWARARSRQVCHGV
jgi:hypothetical protein